MKKEREMVTLIKELSQDGGRQISTASETK